MDEHAGLRYEFGLFQLDPTERLLLRSGEPVPLTPKSFETLALLVKNNGHCVSKEELIEQLWPDTYVEQGNLAVNISALRKALGAGPDGREYIETVPRRGYRFNAQVREARARNNGTGFALATASETRPAGSETVNSLAVFPLVNATDDPNAEYLSDGITESIINTLSQLPQLRVMARSTVFRYKGRDIHPQDAGRELGVHAVLSGRVLQVGDRVVIRAELVDVARGWHLWGEQYDRQPSDLLNVQSEIAREISESLRLKLSGEQRERLVRRHTESTEAYRTYLKGRHYWNKRTLETLSRGIVFFEEAIAMDPRYALAYAGLADSYLLLGSVEYGALDPTVATEKAKRNAMLALNIDPALAAAHASLAYVRVYNWDWEEAEKEYRRAIELNPSYATAHHWYALYLTAMKRPEEALAEIKLAHELDPLSLPINMGVGLHYYLTRQYDKAITEYRKAIELDPNFCMAHFGLAMAYVQNFMHEEAIAKYQTAFDISGGSPLMSAGLGHVYAMSGRRDKARKILRELSEQLQRPAPADAVIAQQYVSPYYLAAINAGLGDKSAAFQWLRQACEMRSEGLFWLQVDPILDNLRADARFADILRRVRLLP